jgi:hypothetical protein
MLEVRKIQAKHGLLTWRPHRLKEEEEKKKLRTSDKLQPSEPITLKGSIRQFNVDNIRRQNRNCTNTRTLSLTK